MPFQKSWHFALLVIVALVLAIAPPTHAQPPAHAPTMDKLSVKHARIKVGDVDLFYREAGDPSAPKIVLLHGFPTSSIMYRGLMPVLAQDYHVIAPDMPGFGLTKAPPRGSYDYTFENLSIAIEAFLKAKRIDAYAMYVMDYGAPVGWRLALRNPKAVRAIVVQNGNAYDEGLLGFWDPFKKYWAENTPAARRELAKFLQIDATNWQYTHGQPAPELVSPDPAIVDQYLMDQGENKEVQLDLFYDYRTNVALYPKVQEYFRTANPPMLVVWGRNDQIFPWQGGEAFRKDVKNLQLHFLDGGHFVLESHLRQVTALMGPFLKAHMK